MTSEKMAEIDNTVDEVIESFDDLELHEDILRGIYSYGFEKPSAIQQRGIKPLIMGRDTIGQAQSGTGKTGAFAIGCLQRIDRNNKNCQALILAPTRELAQQIMSVCTGLGQFMGIKCHACIGGTVVRDDIEKLRSGAQLVVGTPGRVFDMAEKGHLKTDHLAIFVLDEADEMLSRGFKDQIYDVFRLLPQNIQVALFSATLPDEILKLTGKFMRDPIRILVKAAELTLEGISQPITP